MQDSKMKCGGKPRQAPFRFQLVDDAIRQKGSVSQFVKETGISSSAYYQMQEGKTIPTLGTIFAVLKYTGLTFEAAFMN